MATVKGVWVFNSSASTGVYPNVAFSQNVIFDWKSSSYSNITYKNTNFDNDYTYAEVSFGNTVVVFLWNDGGQSNVCNTQIDFGETEQPVSDEFYTWLTANATQQASEEEEEPTGGVTITYNGNVIASLEAGQTATLNCAGKVMAGDIVITCAAAARGYTVTVEPYNDTSGGLYVSTGVKVGEAPTSVSDYDAVISKDDLTTQILENVECVWIWGMGYSIDGVANSIQGNYEEAVKVNITKDTTILAHWSATHSGGSN